MDNTTGFQERKRLWLKAVVENAYPTQREAAEKLNLEPSRLSGLLNGHKAITDDMMDHVAMQLTVPLPVLNLSYSEPAEQVANVREKADAPTRVDAALHRIEKAVVAQEQLIKDQSSLIVTLSARLAEKERGPSTGSK